MNGVYSMGCILVFSNNLKRPLFLWSTKEPG